MGNTDWMMLEMPSDTLQTVGVGTGMEETQREASIVATYGAVEDMVNSMLGRKWEYGFLEVLGQVMTHVRPGEMGRGHSTSILAEEDRGREVTAATWEFLRQGRTSSNLGGLDRSSRGDRFLVNTRKAIRIKRSRPEQQTHFPRVDF